MSRKRLTLLVKIKGAESFPAPRERYICQKESYSFLPTFEAIKVIKRATAETIPAVSSTPLPISATEAPLKISPTTSIARTT